MRYIFLLFAVFLISSCAEEPQLQFDTLILNGLVFSGEDVEPAIHAVGISGDRISFVGDIQNYSYEATTIVDASGKWVTPGFIDPHSHGLEDLFSGENGAGLNNLSQGVTSVFYGNDGYGSPNIAEQFAELEDQGIRYNLAFFVGHGAVRSQVMGRENRPPTTAELSEMKTIVAQAMQEGALGLSTGLFYVPGTYANTDEVVELSKVAAEYGGVYESHIRDESNYNIGLIAAVQEVIDISRRAEIPVHIAHIKALGVDLWGQSQAVISLIEEAQAEGMQISADQYPWLASGIQIHKAIVPSWALEGTEEDIQARLNDPELLPAIKEEMTENIRRRGGPDSLLVVISPDQSLEGNTLADLASQWDMPAVDAALRILSLGVIEPWTRVASFNMSEADVEAFMAEPWVMTSSDGTNGHPRKYASFANKYRQYVADKPVLTPQQFVHRSSALVAETFSIADRGYLKTGYFADIAIIDPQNYRPGADFANWNELATGVEYVFVNGAAAIVDSEPQPIFVGRSLRRN